MSIYGVVTATDGATRICVLEIAHPPPSLAQLLPASGWRPFQCDPGVTQAAHNTPVAGLTMMLGGCMEISVTAGDLSRVALVAGDVLILLDTHGSGHATAITGTDALRTIGVAFAPKDWPSIRDAFTGWPNQLVPPGQSP
ncbi:MAG: hypothetical protein R3E77_06135 [Steroidobacteraceae bacterium]